MGKKAERPTCLDSPRALPAHSVFRCSWLMEFQNQARACRPELLHKLLLLLLTFFLLETVNICHDRMDRDVFKIKTNFFVYFRGTSDTGLPESNERTLL